MEYMSSIDDKLEQINEETVCYYDVFDYPELIFGNPNVASDRVNFNKFPKNIQRQMKQYGKWAENEMEKFKNSSSGTRIRLKTDSKKIIFKVELKNKWEYSHSLNMNTVGFDVYHLKDDKYTHNTVFAPKENKNIFAQQINIPENGKICVFLPNYNSIEKMFIGFENGSTFHPLPYLGENKLPLLFYGSSICQGAGASRSGNSYPNIVSRKLDQDIINLSCQSCCRGTYETADYIGKLNCYAIIIDYTRDSGNFDSYMSTYDNFYKKIRQYHPDIPIVLLTSSCYNTDKKYDRYDEVVRNTFKNAFIKKENTKLLDQKELFENDEYDYITVNSYQYTDYATHKIADKICDLLKVEYLK